MGAIFVSGFSLRLPESDTPAEFWANLMAGRDMVSATPRNWNPDDFGVPPRYGKIRSFDKFDCGFFDVAPKQAEAFDPQLRMLLEVAYEAILDAGVNPAELSGTNTGVFIGACGSDVMSNNVTRLDDLTGYEATGCALSMFANRLSHFFNLKGPSLAVDTACSSSLTAFDLACRAIATGECDRALVGGTSFIFHPLWSVEFNKLNMLSPDGRCMSFNQEGRGFARAEGVVVLLLTRDNVARKRCARVLASRCNNDGYTEQGITFPNVEAQKSLLRDIYGPHGIDPNAVDYTETHGTGTVAGDPPELNAVGDVLFGELGRARPLLVGSVKSNMGHAEGASGLAGIAKVLLAMRHDTIPANLHVGSLRREIPGLHDGRFELVAAHRLVANLTAAISSFGFGGSNAHVVLQKVERPTGSVDAIFLPMPYAARTESTRVELRRQIETSTDNDLSLSSYLTGLHRHPLAKNRYRGVWFKPPGREDAIVVEGQYPEEDRPVWLVLNGVGSQWHGMGDALARFPVVECMLERCHARLAQHGVDLGNLLRDDHPTLWHNPVHVFTGVAAMQVAMYECLRALGVEVAGFFGHSVGELVCAYIDGALTLEQTMDVAYRRGLALTEARFETGAMAAVQTDLATLQALLPPGIEIACHNGTESFTVSGRRDDITAFAAALERQNVPCTMIDTGGIPFHSNLIQGSKNAFMGYLQAIVREPRPRSARWLSTSRRLSPHSGPDLADVGYFVDNLFEPVYFSRCLAEVPANAIVIELGPHGLLKSQVRAALPKGHHVALGKRHVRTPAAFLQGLGELHCLGVGLDWHELLPALKVENADASVPNLAGWNHEATWALPEIKPGSSSAGDFVQDWTIDIEHPENAFVKDHIVNGHPIFPGVGYLHLVWRTLARWKRQDPETLAVELRDVRFVRASIFRNTSALKLTIKIDPLQDRFTVIESGQLVAKGRIESVGTDVLQGDAEFSGEWARQPGNLERDDVYKLFVRTGIEYGNLFRGISLVSRTREQALVDFTHNWPTYFDAVLQLLFINAAVETIGVPRSIAAFRFDPRKLSGRTGLPAAMRGEDASVRTPCVEIEGVTIHSNYAPDLDACELHALRFKPYFQTSSFRPDVRAYLDVCRDVLLNELHRVLAREELGAFTDLGHLPRIEQAIGIRTPPPYPSAEVIEKYRREPDAPMLRMILHVFGRWAELVQDAMPLLLAFAEYKSVYRSDRVFEHRRETLENMLELVVRNTNQPIVRCVEIGAGTGALTSISLPYLAKYAASYDVTDLSSGYFPDLQKEFHLYESKASYLLWDANRRAPRAGYDLVLGSNSVHAVHDIHATLSHVADGLKPGGFFLIEEMTGDFWFSLGMWGFIRDFWKVDDQRTCGMYMSRDAWVGAAQRAGLQLVMSHDVGGALSYLLFRKVQPVRVREVRIPFTRDAAALRQLQTELASDAERTATWIVGDRCDAPGLDGFVRCLAHESNLRVRSLFLADATPIPPAVKQRLQRADLVSNVWQGGHSGAYFRAPLRSGADPARRPSASQDRNHQIRTLTPGNLASVKLVPDWIASPTGRTAAVKFFPLNFKDAMLASGRLASSVYKPFGEPVGLEYAGVLDDGTRIVGLNMSTTGVSGRLSIDDPLSWWVLPPNVSLEEGCTIPVAYATAYAGMVLKAQARAGQRIFIPSGAGAVGQAAIRIALNLGLEIFTTVGSDHKREFLLQRFPALGRENILHSRNPAFKSRVMTLTHGQGVDIVLNSFSGDRLRQSLDLLSRYGHFVDISRYDAAENHALPMKHFLKNISYSNIALDEMYRDKHPDVERIHRFIADGLTRRTIQPISFAITAGVVEGLQELLRGETVGKLVVNMEDCVAKLERLALFHCRPGRKYLITGGLGGVGLELCQWLISRGARELVIVSRSKELDAYRQLKVDGWRQRGVKVEVCDDELGDAAIADAFIREHEAESPIGGVFHLAMILRDRLLLETDFENFELPIRVKLRMAENLDRATRRHCQALEHFVMFSSVVAFYGNEGQSSYGYANSALERLCEERVTQGLPATAIQWGAIGDVGFVAREGMSDAFSHLGMKTMSILTVLDTLDPLLTSKETVTSSYAPLQLVPKQREDSRHRSLLQDVLQIMGFEGAPGEEELRRPLGELGVDSLMIVEINQILARDYGLSLGPKQIRELTLAQLTAMGEGAVKSSAAKADGGQDAVRASVGRIYTLNAIPPTTGSRRLIYYADGMFMDGERNLLNAKGGTDACFVHVPYCDGTRDIASLERRFLTHLEEAAPRAQQVQVVGFSFGSVVASILGEAGKRIVPQLRVRCFAVPKLVYDEQAIAKVVPLVNRVLGHDAAANVDEALACLRDKIANRALRDPFLAAMRREFIAPNESGAVVGYEEILHSLGFLHRSREALRPRACEEITVFARDRMSLDASEASRLSNRVVVIEAAHDSGVVMARAFAD